MTECHVGHAHALECVQSGEVAADGVAVLDGEDDGASALALEAAKVVRGASDTEEVRVADGLLLDVCESLDGIVESAAVRLVVALVLREVGGHDDGVEPSLAHEWQVDAATLFASEVEGVEEHRRVGVRVEGDHGVVQASGVGVAACTTDKMAEEVEHRLVAGGGEPFGVPLDAEDGVFGVLHRLVDAVGRLGRGDETGGQVADGLVVERVDGDGCSTRAATRNGARRHDALQLGIWGSDSDRLRDNIARFRLTMW